MSPPRLGRPPSPLLRKARGPGSDLIEVGAIVEKPDVQTARRRLRVEGLPDDVFLGWFGLHLLAPSIHDILAEMIRSGMRDNGEFQLTRAQEIQGERAHPLAGDFSASPGREMAQEGPYRFVEIAERRGYRPLSLKTKLSFPCAVHQGDRVRGGWHRLTFVPDGSRRRGAIDGRLSFDVNDNTLAHTGPVLDRGRIGLRLMDGTRMYFRNLRIWNRGGPTGTTAKKP